MLPRVIAPLIWVTWLVSWLLAAIGNKRTIAKQPTGSRISYLFPTWIGAMLFVTGQRNDSWLASGSSAPDWVGWAGIAVLVVGLSHTWWARVHLGRNWSAIVTLKEDHQLIQSGPYAITRHPIYTGILTGFIGTWLTHPTVGVGAGVVLFIVSFVIKLGQEERLMVQTFGDAYREYSARVPGLIPFAKAVKVG